MLHRSVLKVVQKEDFSTCTMLTGGSGRNKKKIGAQERKKKRTTNIESNHIHGDWVMYINVFCLFTTTSSPSAAAARKKERPKCRRDGAIDVGLVLGRLTNESMAPTREKRKNHRHGIHTPVSGGTWRKGEISSGFFSEE